MNFLDARAIAYAAYENANPYESQCDEERCICGKCNSPSDLTETDDE